MNIEILLKILAWCSVVNIGLLMLWTVFILVIGDFTFNLQRRFFDISRETFNAVNYGGIGLFKLAIWVLNLTPYLVLQALY